jgi:dipeptidase
MKRILLSFFILLSLSQAKASDSLTVRQVYSFNVGDTFDYRQTVANYDYNLFTTTYSRVVISQKYISPLQDTFIYNNNWVITNLDSIALSQIDISLFG